MTTRNFFATLALAAIFVPGALSAAARQIDPFYPSLLEKAQKAFVAGNYGGAARDFEIAAFGLTGNRTLRAKAHVYLGLCQYYLKDMPGSEKSLRQAAALMGEAGFSSLEIYESAWPDLDKLTAFFDLGRRPSEALPKEVSKPQPADSEPQTSDPVEPAGQNREPDGPKDGAQGQPQAAAPAAKDAPKFKEIKEGDIVPLDFVGTPPVPITRVPAAYPDPARLLRVEGTVTVNALVSETGDVIETRILKGIKNAPGLEQASQQAVRKWKFLPGAVGATRVKVWVPVLIEFKRK